MSPHHMRASTVASVPQPSSGIDYGTQYPIGASQYQTTGAVIGSNMRDGTPVPVAGIGYINQTVGGRSGAVGWNGYSGGLSRAWWGNPFTGRAREFVRRDLVKDTGPVGRDNSRSVLASGVLSQQTVDPSLDDVYSSIVGGFRNGG